MQINNMNRQELMRVGKILLAKKEHIKASVVTPAIETAITLTSKT